MAKSNLLKNIPPKARFMLVTVILVTGGAVFAFFKLASGPGGSVGDSVAGDVNVRLNPSEQQISKASPDEESIIPEGSPLDKEFERIRLKEIEEAKTSEKSFIDELKVKNEDRVIEDLEARIETKTQNNVSGIDDILERRKQEKTQEAQSLEERRKEIIERSNRQSTNQTQNRQRQSSVMFDEDKWLQDQISTVESAQFNDQAVITSIADRQYTMGDYGQSRSSEDVGSNDRSGTSKNAKEDSYFGSYIRTPDQLPDMDLAQLDADRQLAGKSRSSAGKVYQNAGNTGGGNQQTASTYEQSVYPTGMAPEQGGSYVPAGTIYYAVLEIGVNSDEISPVRALVVQEGPLKGAMLLGSPERVGEKVVISFNTISMNGKDYAVNAVALDPETMRTAIADDVDNHTFERYFKLATAAALTGYAEALTATSTTKYSDGSEQQVQGSLPKTEDQIAVALGRVGETLVPIYEKEFGRAPTVSVYPDRDLGIMLMSGLQIQ